MARKRVVSRTVKQTTATCLCVDVTSNETMNQTFTMPFIYKDDETLLKKIKKENETDTVKIVAVITSSVINTLMEMDEEDFIKNARIVDVNE